MDLLSQSPSLLSTPTLADKDRDSYTSNGNLTTKPMVEDHKATVGGQAVTCNDTSKGVGAKQSPQGCLPRVYVCIAKLDHMRNEQKYLKLLNSWAKELTLSGKVLHTGPHSIYVVIVGTNDSGDASVSEFLKRWKTQNVDIDSQGRLCKEKLLSVLCQRPLSGCPSTVLGPR